MESHTQGDLLRTTESVWGLQEKTATCSPWANFLNLQIKFYQNTAILINSYIICSCSWGTTAELSSHNREHMAHIAPNIYSLTEKVCWSLVYSIKSIYFKPLSTKERLELKKTRVIFPKAGPYRLPCQRKQNYRNKRFPQNLLCFPWPVYPHQNEVRNKQTGI